MLIYEVNLFVNTSVYKKFVPWLEEYIKEMLLFDGFSKADIWEWVDEEPSLTTKNICVQYSVKSEQSLGHYFEKHAPRMRNEGLQRFPGGFRATRRVLKNFPA